MTVASCAVSWQRSTPNANCGRGSADERSQQALDETLVVEAAAGTGKTTELVNRIVRILASGRAKVDGHRRGHVHRKGRRRAEAAAARSARRARATARGRRARRVSNEALQSLEEAHVSTIHGFCAELLRERPVEAARRSAVRGADRAAGRAALRAGVRRLDPGRSSQDPPEGVRRALRRSIWQGFGARRARGHADRSAAPRRVGSGPVARLHRRRGRAGRSIAKRRHRRAGRRAARVRRARPRRRRTRRTLCFSTPRPARHLAAEIAIQQEPRSAPSTTTAGRRGSSICRATATSRARATAAARLQQGVTRARVIDAYDALQARTSISSGSTPTPISRRCCSASWRGAIAGYEALKAPQRRARLPRSAAQGARPGARATRGVRRGFQARFTHIFVDEFQDTDPLQAEILLLLASADPEQRRLARASTPIPGRLFIVGDPKQSIYRFRRADVGIYARSASGSSPRARSAVQLTTSFRSVPRDPGVRQRGVRAGDDRRRDHAAGRLRPARRRIAPTIKGQPAVVALPVPEPYGTRNMSAISIEESLPDAVGAFVDWLVEQSGWKVTTRGRPARARRAHICILFRRFLSFGEDVTQPYVRALEARGVPHVLVGGKTFHDREEVETLRAALSAIEWPDDELSVFATLRGALFAIGDEELLEWQQRFGRHSIRSDSGARRRRPSHRSPASRSPTALQLLQRLHRRRNYRPVAETIQELLDATRAHVGIVLRRRRAGARQRAARRRAGAASTRRTAACRSAASSTSCALAAETRARGRGADPRRGQRRRAHDDRAQGEGARVPGRGARRSHVQAVARRRRAAGSIPTNSRLRAEDRRLGADRSPAARCRGGGARPGRGRAPRPTSPRPARATCWSSPPSATGRTTAAGSTR